MAAQLQPRTNAHVVSGNGAGTVSVIDLATNTVTAKINVGMVPIDIAINPAGTEAFVPSDNDFTVSVINLATNTVTATIPVGTFPGGVGVSPAGTDAYVPTGVYQHQGTVPVIDLSTSTVTAHIPVGVDPYGIVVNRARNDAYVTNNDGTISVISLSTNRVTDIIPYNSTENQSLAVLAVNPAGTDAYLTNYHANTVSVFSLTPPTVVHTPARPTAVDGDHEASVLETLPTLGEIPSFYTVTAADTTRPGQGGQTCTITPPAHACTVTRLTNGDSYTFTATATNAVGTSTVSLASYPVTPVPPADLALTLSGPSHAAVGRTVIERVTVTNSGPSNATAVATTLLAPHGLTVTAAPGGTVDQDSGIVNWVDPAVASGKSVIYPVTFAVDDSGSYSTVIGALAEDNGYDPNPANNAAIAAIQLIPSASQRRQRAVTARAQEGQMSRHSWADPTGMSNMRVIRRNLSKSEPRPRASFGRHMTVEEAKLAQLDRLIAGGEVTYAKASSGCS